MRASILKKLRKPVAPAFSRRILENTEKQVSRNVVVRLSLIAGCILSLSSTGLAQYGETIRSGRPGQSIGPFTVGARVFQVQAGIQPSWSNQTNPSNVSKETLAGVGVFRLGLTENFEVAFGTGYQFDKQELNGNSVEQNGLSSFNVRLRSNVFVGRGLVPTIGWQFNLGLPVLSPPYNPSHMAPKITVMTSQKVGKKIGLITNSGVFWNGRNAMPTGFYVINLGYSLSNRFSTFLEHYGFISNGQLVGKFDGGFAYLIHNHLQLDISGGYHEDSNVGQDWFLSFGVSWRTRFSKK